MFLFEPIRNFYGRFERPISSFSLIAGFLFDVVTLKRVDTLWENIWIIIHLIIVGTFIALIHLQESEPGDEKNPSKRHFWYVNILQFFFGGILSTYLVFYFRSSDIFTTWPFILLLAGAFIANESLKRHYIRLSFQVTLFFLSIYSFSIFIVPVLLHQIGVWVFLLSGLISLALIFTFTFEIFHSTKENFRESKKLIFGLIMGVFTVVNILYFTNLIPPIPLSLKDGDVLHSIQKNMEGNYDVTYEDYSWKGYFSLYPDFHKPAGAPVYVFSAIFSPKGLNLTIVHEWQRYDEGQRKWVTESEINLPVVGGRDAGFRTYSMRSNITAGKWRVNVMTSLGQTIGHVRFNIITTDTVPPLSSDTK